MLNIFGNILKSLIVNVDVESWRYCIPRRHRLLGQTTKQPLSNFEVKKALQNISNFKSWGLTVAVYKKNKCIAKIWEKHLKKKAKKNPASLLKISLWGNSVSACANESPGFSVSGASTPNGLFQTINGLKRLVSYSKRLH